MSGQIPLFGDGARAADDWRDILDALKDDLVSGMRLKEAAARLGVDSGTLKNKLDAKNGNVLHAREFFLLLLTATDAQAFPVLEQIAEKLGYILKKKVDLTVAEDYESFQAKVVRRFGEAGVEIVEQHARRR